MAQARPEDLAPLQTLLRQLREIKGMREVRPGTFHNRGTAWLQFLVEDGVTIAELKKPGGSGFDRYALDTPPSQRKLVDDAKRRARGDDE